MNNQRQHGGQDQDEPRETSGQLTDLTHNRGRTIAEWTTLAISAAVLIAIVGMITWLSFRGEEHPPVIIVEAQLGQVRHEKNGYYLPVVIRNEGDATVEDAVIHGELDTGEGEPETVDLTITFLSGGEAVRGTMVFQADPAAGELTTGVASYRVP